jgi:hypothetical protein
MKEKKSQNLTNNERDVITIEKSVIIEILKLVDEGFTLKKRLKKALHGMLRGV